VTFGAESVYGSARGEVVGNIRGFLEVFWVVVVYGLGVIPDPTCHREPSARIILGRVWVAELGQVKFTLCGPAGRVASARTSRKGGSPLALSVVSHLERTYNPNMERTETRIDRALVERAREQARREGREESDVIEDALRRYLVDVGEVNFGEILDSVADWRRERGVEPLSEEEAMKLAVEEQHAHRRGE
jgi:hypothetical protein